MEEMEREITYNADHNVSRYEIESRRSYERELAQQQLELERLQAEKISDAKDIELYKQFRQDLKEALEPIKDDIHNLQAKASAQDAWNAAQQGALACLRGDVNDLLHLTRRKIPNEVITPGWGDIP